MILSNEDLIKLKVLVLGGTDEKDNINCMKCKPDNLSCVKVNPLIIPLIT